MERAPEDEAIAEPVDARRFNEVMGSNRFRQADYRRLACRAVDVGIPPRLSHSLVELDQVGLHGR